MKVWFELTRDEVREIISNVLEYNGYSDAEIEFQGDGSVKITTERDGLVMRVQPEPSSADPIEQRRQQILGMTKRGPLHGAREVFERNGGSEQPATPDQ